MTLGDELPEAMLVERELERSRSRFVPTVLRNEWRGDELDYLHRAIEEKGQEVAAMRDQLRHLPAELAEAVAELVRLEARLEQLRGDDQAAAVMAHPSFVSRTPDSPDPRLCPGMGVDEREQFR